MGGDSAVVAVAVVGPVEEEERPRGEFKSVLNQVEMQGRWRCGRPKPKREVGLSRGFGARGSLSALCGLWGYARCERGRYFAAFF